jgi:hypothetical protein
MARAMPVLVLALVACTKASEEQRVKRMPLPPPPESAQPASELRIQVEIDGAVKSSIDAARLASLKPDYQDEERRAWRLATVLGSSVDRPGAVIAVTGEKGLTLVVHPPKSKDDPTPVFALTRRGEAVVAMVAQDEPFPPYHGRGGRLNRPGDPLPRISGVTHVKVYVEADARAPEPAPSIEVTVAGSPAGTWTAEELSKVPRFGDAGDREIWSLRDATRVLVGPKARVVALVGDGKRVTVDAQAWADRSRTPILKLNRGHAFKFLWLPEKDGAPELKGIQKIETE